MQVTSQEILFESPIHCREFLNELKLIGEVRFSRAIEDHSGSVMVRENIAVKQSLLDRLSEMPDDFRSQIGVEISDELLVRVRSDLSARVLKRIERPGNPFLRRLFSNQQRSPRPYVLHAFRNRSLALFAIRMTRDEPERFERLATMGLLTLGLVLQEDRNAPLMHRHAFLAGFACMVGGERGPAAGRTWLSKAERAAILEISAANAKGLGFPAGLDQVLLGLQQPVQALPATAAAATGTEEITHDATAVHPDAIAVLTEGLRIALFAQEIIDEAGDTLPAAEELVHRLAYNSARGYFNTSLADAALRRFTEYHNDIRHLQRIASIEEKCREGRLAWAYPKPKATQVLCSGKAHACPLLRSGQDVHVVGRQRPFGRIGNNLEPGIYPKCALEDQLSELNGQA